MIRQAAILLLVSTRLAAADDSAQKDRDTALWWSVGGTAVSAGFIAAAALTPPYQGPRQMMAEVGLASMVLTPSLGELYAGKYLTLGMGLRAAGGATALLGILYSYCIDSTCNHDTGPELLALGVVTAGVGVVYDIAMARSAVDDYNAARARIVPMVLQSPSGPAVGAGLGGTF